MSQPLAAVVLRYERDVVLARARAREIASRIGFDAQDQTRIATAVSEIARNAFTYGEDGRVEFHVQGTTRPQLFLTVVADQGPGIGNVQDILEGRYRSSTGMGLGIVGARRLMDHFTLDSSSGRGTRVALGKLMPSSTPILTPRGLADLREELARQRPQDPLAEIQRQNQELLDALGQLARRQDELVALNRELEDTNRGVVALYAELDERADHLRRADELKSRFISNMSHEFRTPVNSIQALSRLLLEGTDGPLSAEQERQVVFIRKAADALAELVDDLLDLAKVEAGKIEVQPTEFEVENLFGALRGMLRPLLVNESMALVFESDDDLPHLWGDESKLSQILRNLVSNALKFTERGEVRVSARMMPDRAHVAFAVQDSGIGIAPEDQERVFQEFVQIDSPIQRRVKGTGLGLPLCRRLAELLGGRLELESAPGVGSTFTCVLPIRFPGSPAHQRPEWRLDPRRIPVLVVDDAPEDLLLYEKFLNAGGYQVLAARSLREAREAMAHGPVAVVLDLLLRGEDGWTFLAELKRSPQWSRIPVALATNVEDEAKALALGADAYLRKPVGRQRLLDVVSQLVDRAPRRILLVDDEEISRYLLRQHIPGHHEISEVSNGAEAIDLARRERPDVICLDLMMPGLDGYEVLRVLREDPATRSIPVVVFTSKRLEPSERMRLEELDGVVLPKGAVSRERALAAIEEARRAVGATS